MASDDQAYFYQRAETELQQAQQATDPAIASVHYQLAEAYLAKLPSGRAQAPTS